MTLLGLELLWAPPPGLPHAHDATPVAISIFVAILAAYTALSLSENMLAARGTPRLLWLSGAALALGGGIWTMHFTAMLAFVLPVPVRYDPWLTAASGLTAIAFTGAAFAAVSHFGPRTGVVLLAGFLAGLGIAAMHYMGMAAMRLPAGLAYDASLFLLSIAIACLAAAVALWLAFRGTNLRERLAAAVVMGAAISSMHYVGMAAARFDPAVHLVDLPEMPAADTGYEIALAIGFAVSCLLGLALFRSVLDRERAALAEARLQAAEAARSFVQSALDGLSDAVLLLDAEGRVRYAAGGGTAALEERLGGPLAGELAAQLPKEAGRRLREGLAEAWREGASGPFDLSLPGSGEGGGEQVFEAMLRRLHSGEEELLVATLHDVTARAALLQAIDRARASAEASDRLKSSFLGTMSHELRTPLNAVIGFSDLIRVQGHALTGEQLWSYAGDINQAGQQLLTTLEAILDFARVSAGDLRLRPEANAPAELIETALRALGPRASSSGVSLAVRLPTEAPLLLVDRRSLGRALLELLENAVDFSPAGATVEVGLDQGGGEGEVGLFVRDAGPGIEPAVLPHLARPFVQRDPHLARSRQGLGLGLALARGIAEAHSGRLEIDSRPGEGTLVRLLLPATCRVAARDRTAAAGASSQPALSGKQRG